MSGSGQKKKTEPKTSATESRKLRFGGENFTFINYYNFETIMIVIIIIIIII